MSSRSFMIVMLAAAAYGQSDVRPALHIQNVAASVNYYSLSPEATSSAAAQRNAGAAGISSTLVYNNFDQHSGISLAYTPSYIGRYRSSSGNTTNHFLLFSGHAGPNSRLTFNYSVNGMLSSTSDVLFTQTQLGRLAGASAPAGGLGSAVVTGAASGNEVSTVLAEAPGVGSPAGLMIYGERLWEVAASTGVNYAYTTRLAVHMNIGAMKTATFQNASSEPANPYIIPYTVSGSAEGGFTYLLSPRSRIGGGVQSTRFYSRLQDYYVHTASLSLARTMGIRWFVDVHGGAAVVNAGQGASRLPHRVQPAGGGLLGYRTFANTFLLAVERSAGDAYAAGSTSTLIGSVAWVWRRPGEPWSLRSELSEERLSGLGFTPVHAFRASAGIGRQLSRHFSVLLQYAYLGSVGENNARFVRPPNQHNGRVSFLWEPYGAAAQ